MSEGARDEPRRPRVAFIASGDPRNVRTWSGTPYHMLQALERRLDVALVVRRPWPLWFAKLRGGLRKLSGRRIDLYWSPLCARFASRSARRAILTSDCDLVIGVAITPILAELIGRKPTLYVSDATLALMANYYPFYRKMWPAFRNRAHATETRCIRDADAASFPSSWAAGSAIRDHQGNPDRIFQIEWGANMPGRDPKPPSERPKKPWRLLFAGVGFEGKGGWIAIQAVQEMRRRGYEVTLDMLGSMPSDPPPSIEGVTFHGFLRKDDPAQRAKMEELFRAAHLFVLPTAFDCFPTVIAEAASYGLPSVAYRTGGLESNVRDGETGLLLPAGAPPEAWADAIIGLMSDWPRYAAMAEEALRFSHETLNWERWAERIAELVEQRLARCT